MAWCPVQALEGGELDEFDWRKFQQEYRDYIDLAKLAQLIPVIGAPVGVIGSDELVLNSIPAGRREILAPGMTLAIEPMVNAGGAATKALSDGWTVVTADGSLSAHFEHTVAITADGPLILTASGDREPSLLP